MIVVHLSEDALRDLQDGYSFYEAQEPGLGDYFLSYLLADIEDSESSGVLVTPFTTPSARELPAPSPEAL